MRVRAPQGRAPHRLSDDRGSAVAEFVMISVLLVFLLFGVLQVAAILYVRSVVVSAASDGARYGANAGIDPVAGGPRASSLIATSLSAAVARDIPCQGARVIDPGTGLATAKVDCRGEVRSILLPIGKLVSIEVTGESLAERP
jgi:Flp pilus assembly protein TadG